MQRLRTNIGSSGFTLVEALVALVILAATFTATWGWFNSSVRNTASIERAVSLPIVFDEFVERLNLIDLKKVRNGEFAIGHYKLVWQARENRISTQEYYRRQPKWIVVLFDIDVEVREEGKLVSTFTTQQMSQWRDPNYVENPFGDF